MLNKSNNQTPMEEGIYRVLEEFETDHLVFWPEEEAIVEKDDKGNLFIFRPGIMREYGDPITPDLWNKIKRIGQLVN